MRSFRIALVLGLLTIPGLGAPQVTPPSRPAHPAGVTRIPDVVSGRLKAAGLDPADPQLGQKLGQRLQSSRQRVVRPVAISVQPLTRQQAGALGIRVGRTSGTKLPPGLSKERKAARSAPASMQIAEASLSPYHLETMLRVVAAKHYGANDITYRLTPPECGLDVSGTMSSGNWICCLYDANGAEQMDLEGHPPMPFVFGAKPRMVKLTVNGQGLPPATRLLEGVPASGGQTKITLTVDALPPHLPANQLGLQAANVKFGGNGARASRG